MLDLVKDIYRIMSSYGSSPCVSYGKNTLSYIEILSASYEVREELLKYETLKGKIVAVRCTSPIDFLIYFLALIKLEAVIFPIAHDVPVTAVKEQLSSLNVDYLITTLTIDKNYPHSNMLIEIADTSFFKLQSIAQKFDEIDFSNGGFIRFTSGTTGISKGVFISFKSATERVNALSSALLINAKDVVLNLMPCAYHFIVSLLHFLNSGAHILIPRSNTITMMLELKELSQVSFIYAAPYHYDLLLGLHRESLGSNLKLAISTGDILQEHTKVAFFNKFLVPISSAYGLIEVGLPIVNFRDGSRNDFPDSTGKAYVPYQIKVISNQAQFPKTGVLAISGPGMFDAYLYPSKKREDVLLDGWFITGDQATIYKTGDVVIHGRQGSVIKYMGHKIYPLEIESVLNQYPGMLESLVYGIENPKFGSIIVAKVVLREDIIFDVLAIKRFCKTKLEKFKIPKILEQAQSIEKTVTGKVRRDGTKI